MESLTSLIDLLNGNPKELTDFLANHIASCDADRTALAAIRPSNRRWFANPEPGEERGYVLAVGRLTAESRMHLPADYEYRALRITGLVPVLSLEIDTASGTTRTNTQELGKIQWERLTEMEKQAAFQTLTGKYQAPVPRVKAVPFSTELLGELTPDEYGDVWEAKPLAVGYFDGLVLPVALQYVSSADRTAIDEALANFLRLDGRDKAMAATAVLANCQNFLGMIDLSSEAGHAMAALTNPDDIWTYVDCQSLSIVRDDGDGEPSLYVVLVCECEWEPEHGLQIIYRNGSQLCRVSEQDGSVID